VVRPDPAAEWERFGREDPYYGVWVNEEFRGRDLDPERRARFFASGEEHLATTLSRLRKLTGASGEPEVVLDYGCGVGRVLIPLARRASRAIGVDVSPSMLAEARRNLHEAGLQGVELLTPDSLDRLAPEFDLVHSAIVLQHIPVREGERIVGALAGLLRPGGAGAIQLPIAARSSLRAFNALMKVPLASKVLNVVRGRRWSDPHMQMNVYDLSRLVLILHGRGIEVVHVCPAPPAAGFQGCTLYFRR
jgi:SAM-dependent methyltransferase